MVSEVACGLEDLLRFQERKVLKVDADIQTFLNIHFQSKRLAEALLMTNNTAMLHFIYNPNVESGNVGSRVSGEPLLSGWDFCSPGSTTQRPAPAANGSY